MKTKQRKVELPTMIRAASVLPKSIDPDKRTVEVTFTKGTRVLRRGFFEDFFEELSLEDGAVRMGRLENGAPVLDTHGMSDRRGVAGVLGVVERAEIVDGTEGRATLRFSSRDDVTPIFDDIKSGILRNVSVGYSIYRAEKVGEENDIPVLRATDWEPVEISIVPAGADPTAQVRSQEKDQLTECVLTEFEEEKRVEPIESDDDDKSIDTGEKVLDESKKETRNEKVEKPETLRQNQNTRGQDEMDPKELERLKKEAREEGVAAENKRINEIRAIVRKVDLGDEFADEMISENKSVDEVRTLVIEKIAEKDKQPEKQTKAANIELGTDHARAGRIEGMASALLHRFRPKAVETRHNEKEMTLPGYELAESGREYAYMSLIEMARACLESQGVRTGGMPKHTIADMALNMRSGYHSTSDFPEILANVANKTLRDGYQAAPITWRPFVNEVFVSDFKEISRTNLGDAPKLEKLAEGSEVKRGSISEAAEKYQIEEYAKIIAVSRKTLINDDLGAFTRIPERMGRRASDLESDLVYEVLKANAALADGNALFSAPHNNLSTSPASPSEAGLQEARAAMRRQVGLDGAEISLTPVWFYVPPEHETDAEKLIASIVPDSSTNVSPFSSAGRTPLRLEVEPRFETGANGSTDAWYVFADRGQVDMLELARLEGTDGPQIQTRDGFDVAGMEIKIMHDVAAKAIDFRGMFKNAGV